MGVAGDSVEKLEYGPDPVCLAPWARFSDADVGDLIINVLLNGDKIDLRLQSGSIEDVLGILQDLRRL